MSKFNVTFSICDRIEGVRTYSTQKHRKNKSENIPLLRVKKKLNHTLNNLEGSAVFKGIFRWPVEYIYFSYLISCFSKTMMRLSQLIQETSCFITKTVREFLEKIELMSCFIGWYESRQLNGCLADRLASVQFWSIFSKRVSKRVSNALFLLI